jgi:hypothetical protein
VNSFSALSDNEIIKISKDMGVVIDDNNFVTIDLIK